MDRRDFVKTGTTLAIGGVLLAGATQQEVIALIERRKSLSKEDKNMPFVSVRMTPKTPDQVKQMADKITNVIAETCNLPKDVIWIVFETIPQEAWSVSGKLLKDPTQKDG